MFKKVNDKEILILCVTFVLLILISFAAIWIGQYPISFSEYKTVICDIFGFLDTDIVDSSVGQIKYIIEEIRFPRILAAILVGAALSVCGAVFQGIFVNPLVSPGILGVLSGASFGAALAMVFGLSAVYIQIFAFTFGFVAVITALWISSIYKKGNGILMLVLGGIISSAFFSALLSLVKYTADPYNVLPGIVYWLMGSLAYTELKSVLIAMPWMIFSIFALIFLSKQLNILSLGEDEAKSLGINVSKMRLVIIALATMLGSISVMLSGIIGWIGLIVPHIARMLIGANHIYLIPMSALVGGLFLLVADTISRTVFAVEIPLGIVTSLVGIPIFIIILGKISK